MLGVVLIIVLRGVMKGADIYEAFLRGACRGMRSAVDLLPALCAMMLMIGMMNSSGITHLLSRALSPVMKLFSLPVETAPVLLFRPLTGSGSLAALAQIFEQHGADSRAGVAASVLMGSSETIFYTMTVYLGAAGVRKVPKALPVSILSYLVGAFVCGMIV